MVKIGSARIDENGKIMGGKPGDQTGKEVCIENFYMHKKGWIGFFPKDLEVAKNLAKSMTDACENDDIGYTQATNERVGVTNEVKKGTKIKDIKHPLGADCSDLVRACILESTGKDLGLFNTASEPDALNKSGLFEEPVEITSEAQLKVGMILVTKTKGHTAIVTQISADKSNVTTKTEPTKDTKSNQLKIDVAKHNDKTIAGTYVATGNLNLRTGAGINKPRITIIPKNAICTCYGFYNKLGMSEWYCVEYKGQTGYCNSDYLRRM